MITNTAINSHTVYDEAVIKTVDPAAHIPGPLKVSTPTTDEAVIGAPTVSKEAYM